MSRYVLLGVMALCLAVPAIAPFVVHERVAIFCSGAMVAVSALSFTYLIWLRPWHRLLAYVAYCELVTAAFCWAGLPVRALYQLLPFWVLTFGMYWLGGRRQRLRLQEESKGETFLHSLDSFGQQFVLKLQRLFPD